MSSASNDWLLLLLIISVIGGTGYWYLNRNEATAPVSVSAPSVPIEEAVTPEGPRFPVSADTMETPAELIELPPLNDSDAYFKLALKDLFGATLDALLIESGGIERFVVTVDNLPRSKLSERMRPVSAVSNALMVEPAGEGLYSLSAENSERYETYVRLFEQADMDAIVASYRRFYPLLQQAYVALGYPDGYFNDRLVEVIDHLLDTPDVTGPVLLRRPHVLYQFADPSHEALSSGQKILVRIGPEASIRIRNRLSDLRSRLTELRQAP